MNNKPFKLVSNRHAVFFGVCGGIAYYFGISAWLVRILFVLFGVSIFFYLLIAIFSDTYENDPEDYDQIC